MATGRERLLKSLIKYKKESRNERHWNEVIQQAKILSRTSSVESTQELCDMIDCPGGILSINCFGLIAPGCDSLLESIFPVLPEAGVNIAVPSSDEELYSPAGHNTLAVRSNGLLSSGLIPAQAGSLGLITCDTISYEERDSVVPEILNLSAVLRAQGAQWILLYVLRRNQSEKRLPSETAFARDCARFGVDYIISCDDGYIDGGLTCLGSDGNIVRVIGSLGESLSETAGTFPVLHLKLKSVNGRLTLFQETWIPMYREDDTVSRLDKPGCLAEDDRLIALGALEKKMLRMQPIGRMLTLGKLCEVIGSPLPDEYAYLSDFSIGKLCARSIDVIPGDIFFFRQQFNDLNDINPPTLEEWMDTAKRAVERGALFSISYCPLPFACAHLVCEDTREAHITASAYFRSLFPRVRTICVTGSVGKTSTKDILAEVLAMRYRTKKSEKNGNVQVNIGIHVQRFGDDTEVFIQETGGGRPGGASRHARMILPEAAIVTNIGDAHIGNFEGSRERLMLNKLGIAEGLIPGGTLYLNADDPLLSCAEPACNVVTFAVKNPNADYHVEDISMHGFTTRFTIIHGEERWDAELGVPGEHNILNAVCAFAIASQFDIPPEARLAGLKNFHTSGVRQNLVEASGRLLLMDCFNASSESIKASTNMLFSIAIPEGARRIAVLGDITGMGESAEEIHCTMAENLLEFPLHHIALFGTDVRFAKDTLDKNGVDSFLFETREELNDWLERETRPGDAVLFKGSSKMLMEYSADMVFGTRFTDFRFLEERVFRRAEEDGMSFNLFEPGYATLVRLSPTVPIQDEYIVPEKVFLHDVVNLAAAFRRAPVKSIILPDTIRHIAARCFSGCGKLENIRISPALKYIGDNAFRNCFSLKSLTLPDGILHICERAFAGCRNLTELHLPESIAFIGKDAFSGCSLLRFTCIAGSYSHGWLEENNLPYDIVEFRGAPVSDPASGRRQDAATADFSPPAPLQIIAQPESRPAAVGHDVIYSVVAVGDDLEYQWQFRKRANEIWKNSKRSDAKTSSLVVNATEARNGYQYRCVIIDSHENTVISEPVEMMLLATFELTGHPQSFSGKEGNTAVFFVAASGIGLSYQWQFKRSAADKDWKNNKNLKGCNTPKLTVPAVSHRNGFRFRCMITDANSNTIFSNEAVLNILE